MDFSFKLIDKSSLSTQRCTLCLFRKAFQRKQTKSSTSYPNRLYFCTYPTFTAQHLKSQPVDLSLMHQSLLSLSPSLINMGYACLDKKWNYDNVISPFTRMYYITKGHARVFHHNLEFELKPDHIYLIPSFTYSRYKCDAYMEQYYISFFENDQSTLSVYNLKSFVYEKKATDLDKLHFERLLQINPNRSLINNDPKVYDNLPTLLSYKELNDQISAAAYIETQGLLLSLFSRFITDKPFLAQSESIAAQKITDSIKFIHKNLQQELSVEALAKEACMNTDYYSRVFKKLFGIRPIQYIQTKRIERAQLLLTTTTQSIPEIAHKSGLPNLSYFSRLFKKIVNKSPAAFRKEHWKL